MIGTPENPYVATWEDTTTHHQTCQFKRTRRILSVSLAKEDILFRFGSLVQNAGEKLVSSDGQSLTLLILQVKMVSKL